MKSDRQTQRRHRVIWTAIVAGMFLVTAHSPAHAVTIFTAELTGSQETPPNASAAIGVGVFSLNDSMTALKFGVVFVGLESTFAAAHFHVGAPGVAGPIVRGMLPAETFLGFGGRSGFFTGVWTSTDGQALTETLVAALFAGNIYFNIHSSVFPGGEIRGQLISQTPEPASLLLIGSGLAAFGFAVWRRARPK